MAAFSKRVLGWFAEHGRGGLPWQQDIFPYRVWVSETMLQQTQVAVVIPYFVRFIKRFPNVTALAEASLDEVLNLWSGLGFYSRARNLHKAAQHICAEHQGRLPETLVGLQVLPGIGRSTAGAILSIGCGRRGVILDGNVKRVLARYFAVPGVVGDTALEQRLWQHAERLTPAAKQAGAYAQAMMDIGATVCTRRAPNCLACPLQRGCSAYKTGNPLAFPAPKPKRKKPVQKVFALVLQAKVGVLLVRRPEHGVWGGLWSLPEIATPTAWPAWLDAANLRSERMAVVHHEFTHFKLEMVPIRLYVEQLSLQVADGCMRWYRGQDIIGLPAPVKKLLATLENSPELKGKKGAA